MSSVKIVSSLDSRAEILMINTGANGGVFHTNQTVSAVDAPWRAWDSLAPASIYLSQPMTALDGKGRLALAWLNGGAIWVSHSNVANGALAAAQELANLDLVFCDLTTNFQGFFAFIGMDTTGAVWILEQTADGSWDNLAKHSLGGHALRQVAVTTYGPDSRLTVVALGGDRQVYRTEEQGAGNAWGAWINLEGVDIQGVEASANDDGRLEITAVGGDGNLYQANETLAGGWSGWRLLSEGHFADSGRARVVKNQNGRLEVFAIGDDGLIYHTWQVAKNEGWVHAVVALPPVGPIMSAAVNALVNGRLVLAVADDGCGCIFLTQPAANALTFEQLDEQPQVPCPAPPATIQIVKFIANPTYINPGEASTLEWVVAANASCNPLSFELTKQVNGGAATKVPYQGFAPTNGSLPVFPDVTTKYTLSVGCPNDGASSQASVTVAVYAG